MHKNQILTVIYFDFPNFFDKNKYTINNIINIINIIYINIIDKKFIKIKNIPLHMLLNYKK